MTKTVKWRSLVRWYSPSEGGRKTGPPGGDVYMATAVVGGKVGDSYLGVADDHFSVVLELLEWKLG